MVTLPDVIEAARAMLVVGTLFAIFAVCAAVDEILERFGSPFDDDTQEDAA